MLSPVAVVLAERCERARTLRRRHDHGEAEARRNRRESTGARWEPRAGGARATLAEEIRARISTAPEPAVRPWPARQRRHRTGRQTVLPPMKTAQRSCKQTGLSPRRGTKRHKKTGLFSRLCWPAECVFVAVRSVLQSTWIPQFGLTAKTTRRGFPNGMSTTGSLTCWVRPPMSEPQ